MRLLCELKDTLDLDAFDDIDVQFDVGKSDETPRARTFGNEQVETELHRRLDHRLETKAAELAKSNDRSQSATTATRDESPKAVAEARSNLRELVEVFRKAGYRLAPKIIWIAVKGVVRDLIGSSAGEEPPDVG